jgi:hypothetical protein
MMSMHRSGVPIVAIASTSPKEGEAATGVLQRRAQGGLRRGDDHEVLERQGEGSEIAPDRLTVLLQDRDLVVQPGIGAGGSVPDVGLLGDEAQHLALAR